MTEFEALYRRRRYLLEQIGDAENEIDRIEARLAFLRSQSPKETFYCLEPQP